MRLSLTILLSFAIKMIAAQKGSVAGRVMDSRIMIPVPSAVVKLTPSKKTVVADINGNFRVDSLPTGKYTVEIISIGYPVKSFTVDIAEDLTSILNAELSVYCKYDAHKNDNTCPVCHRKNKVIPIVYGLPIGEMDTDNYRYAGCEITSCDPNWYCKTSMPKPFII